MLKVKFENFIKMYFLADKIENKLFKYLTPWNCIW